MTNRMRAENSAAHAVRDLHEAPTSGPNAALLKALSWAAIGSVHALLDVADAIRENTASRDLQVRVQLEPPTDRS